MWSLFVIAAAIVAAPQQTSGASASAMQEARSRVLVSTERPEFLELTLASPVQLPNGRHVGSSVRPAVSAEPWFVYSRGNLCQSAITHGPAPTDATDGWKVTITERSRTATHVAVTITWVRMWEYGRAIAAGSGGTSELTLRRNDRIPLDMITRPAQPGVCAGTTKSLEVHVGRPVLAPAVPAGDSPLDGIVDAEIWMVHQAPGGVETVERQTVRLINGPVGFSFRSAPIDTPDGPVMLELSGQLKAVQEANGSRALWAGLTRMVICQSTGATAFASTTEGTVDWLERTDVVSFDLPPLQLFAGARRGGTGGGGAATAPVGGTGSVVAGVARGTGGAVVSGGRPAPGPNLLEGHRLSLRVRLSETR